MVDNPILERNIYQEAKVHVYNGIDLPARGNVEVTARRQAIVEDLKKQWEEEFQRPWTFGSKPRVIKQWTTDQRKSIEERLAASLAYTGKKLELTTEEMNTWLEWANNRYEISADNEVISYAREDRQKNGKPQVWATGSEAAAEDKIADLLQWIIWNRSIGRGDVIADLSGVKELR